MISHQGGGERRVPGWEDAPASSRTVGGSCEDGLTSFGRERRGFVRRRNKKRIIKLHGWGGAARVPAMSVPQEKKELCRQ